MQVQEFVDQEKIKVEEIEIRSNPRFGLEREDVNNAMEKDLPVETIYMIGVHHNLELENRIWGEIYIVKHINEVLSVQLVAKRTR